MGGGKWGHGPKVSRVANPLHFPIESRLGRLHAVLPSSSTGIHLTLPWRDHFKDKNVDFAETTCTPTVRLQKAWKKTGGGKGPALRRGRLNESAGVQRVGR